ncbi:MAG: hypothetical protein J6T05_03495 [Prevotella sp.]|nr:hypothetical protein [Prevotella sp.]
MTKIATPHFDLESKKTYIQPDINVVILQHQQQLLNASSVETSGLDTGLGYDKNGGNQGEAW